MIVPKGQTVTGNFYTNSYLSEVEKQLFMMRPRTGAKGLRLLHDNARPHKTIRSNPRSQGWGWLSLNIHPPYSPDLAYVTFIASLSSRNILPGVI